jgi:D-alanyl-D-alanine carboxypeptidase
MALITKEALTHPEFVEITSTLEYTIPATNMTAEPRYLTHSNRMIQESTDYYYPYCIGGKTGFTEMAQGTFVAWAEHNGVELICVTMKTNTNANNYTDTIALFNYCFNNYSAIKPLEHHEFTAEDIKDAENYLNDYYGGKNLGTLELATDKDYYFLLENTKEINQVSYRYVMSTDHLDEGTLGYIEVSDGATILAEVPFTYSGYINSEDEAAVQAAIAAGIIEAPKVKKVNKVLITVITILVIIAVTCFTIFYIKYRKIQKARLAYKRKRDLARKNGRSF